MADSFVRVPTDSTGKRVDATSLDVGADTVYRQRIVIGDNSATAQFALVTGGALTVTGNVNLSATAIVAISTPFTLNNISATVTVAGVVGLTAGTANIGHLNHISRTVEVAIQTPFTVNNISATVTVAGVIALTAGSAVIGDINAISRTVQVAIGTPFTVNNISATVNTVIGAGSSNIGSINNISATVTTVTAGFTPEVPSASHGPRCVTASTSANVMLIAAPGAGLSIHVTSLAVSNAGTVGSRARVGPSASTGTVTMFMASAGGGFVIQYDPPWKLSANEALLCSVDPNTSDALFNVNYFVKA